MAFPGIWYLLMLRLDCVFIVANSIVWRKIRTDRVATIKVFIRNPRFRVCENYVLVCSWVADSHFLGSYDSVVTGYDAWGAHTRQFWYFDWIELLFSVRWLSLRMFFLYLWLSRGRSFSLLSTFLTICEHSLLSVYSELIFRTCCDAGYADEGYDGYAPTTGCSHRKHYDVIKPSNFQVVSLSHWQA
jgi:hypothetical protein